MQRRELMQAMAAFVATCIASSGEAAVALSPTLPATGALPNASGIALATLNSRASAAAIGRAYMAGSATAPSLARLLAEMDAALHRFASPDRRFDYSDRTSIATALMAAIEDDFARERMVQVDGWFLSDTEARLCALCALETDDPASEAWEG